LNTVGRMRPKAVIRRRERLHTADSAEFMPIRVLIRPTVERFG
jgi:hypothetical protein